MLPGSVGGETGNLAFPEDFRFMIPARLLTGALQAGRMQHGDLLACLPRPDTEACLFSAGYR